MNISEFASNQQSERLKGDFNVGVLKQQLNAQKEEGKAVLKLLDSSGIQRGANEPGKGHGVDRTA